MHLWAMVYPSPHLGSNPGTHPFAAIFPCAGKHFLQGSDWQGLLQHKTADTQVWRNKLWGKSQNEDIYSCQLGISHAVTPQGQRAYESKCQLDKWMKYKRWTSLIQIKMGFMLYSKGWGKGSPQLQGKRDQGVRINLTEDWWHTQ